MNKLGEIDEKMCNENDDQAHDGSHHETESYRADGAVHAKALEPIVEGFGGNQRVEAVGDLAFRQSL